MNRFILWFSMVLVCSAAYCQNWAGFETGRFAGISSANLRPAGMAPMPYKVDATLIGMHLNSQPKNIFNKDFLKVTLTGGFISSRDSMN